MPMTHAPRISEQEFLAAYDEHADAVFRHCYLRTLDHERSKELMCESFQRLWLFIADGNAVDSLKMFLFRAANALITEAGADASEMSEKSPMHAAVVAALEKIPATHRAPFLLHSLEGFSANEISQILGGSADAHAVAIKRSNELLAPIPIHAS